MKNLEKSLAAVVIVVFLLYAAINYYLKTTPSPSKIKPSTLSSHKIAKKELNELEYIMDVINNGSNRLGFKGGEMEGGFIPTEKAKDVACYLLSLRGTPCKEGFSQDAPLYFSSNCAGCHGMDAKGIKGSYPNLLRKPLLGLEK